MRIPEDGAGSDVGSARQSGASDKNLCVRGSAVHKQQITLDFRQKTHFIPLFPLDFDVFGRLLSFTALSVVSFAVDFAEDLVV